MPTTPRPPSKARHTQPPRPAPAQVDPLAELLDRCHVLPDAAKRKQLQDHVRWAIHRVEASSLHSRLDAVICLGLHLRRRGWRQAKEKDVITAIADHRFQRGAHLAANPTALPWHPLAASTKFQYAVHIRTFYKWLLKTRDTPDFLRDLPFRKVDLMQERCRELALKPGEIKMLLAGARTKRDRCILVFLLETGFRVSEAAACRLDLMEQRNSGYWFTLNPEAPDLKTGVREVAVPVIAGVPTLEAWLDDHPRRQDSQPSLFVNLSNRNYGAPMTGRGIAAAVVRCARRGGLRKHAHTLRHTSASLKVVKGMDSETLRLTHGWKKGSKMPSYYADVKPYYERLMLQVHGLKPQDEPEILDILGAVPCGLCGAANTIEATHCKKCDVLLARSAQESERQHRHKHLLDYAAPGAVEALFGVLTRALARALGWNGQEAA